ncbi:MAG: hypothetical protein COA47_06730 [Robiginitomaculum sp.]|nr:MAG: hypothetical protein COA47_06730 [Robiginitomaculum sp.]
MTQLDDAIREALSSDEANQLDALVAPQGIWGLLGNVLQGRMAGWMWLSAIMQFIMFGAALWAGWHFFHAETGRNMALWGFGTGFFSFAMAMLKMWFLQQIDKQEILREIKRLELQLALVAQKIT